MPGGACRGSGPTAALPCPRGAGCSAESEVMLSERPETAIPRRVAADGRPKPDAAMLADARLRKA